MDKSEFGYGRPLPQSGELEVEEWDPALFIL